MTPLLFRPGRRVVLPIARHEAQAFVARWHRHTRAQVGEEFCLGLYDYRGRPLGCVVVGRPVARKLDNGTTREVTRCCVVNVEKGAAKSQCRGARPSDLYLAALHEAFTRWGSVPVVTYTLATEPGTSLLAAGFERSAEVRGQQADRPSRPREIRDTTPDRVRWATVARPSQEAARLMEHTA